MMRIETDSVQQPWPGWLKSAPESGLILVVALAVGLMSALGSSCVLLGC